MMPELDGKALVEKVILEHWTSAEGIAALAAYVAPGYVHHAPMADVGFDGFVQGITALRTAFPDLAYTITHVLAEGDLFAAHLRARGTHLGPFGPIAPTGKAFSATGAYHCRVVNGQIVEDWDVWTALGMPRQIGTLLSS